MDRQTDGFAIAYSVLSVCCRMLKTEEQNYLLEPMTIIFITAR